ncbi:MAG: GGDEF domain-containing protein [Lachnospiraceae bacterium]|nr:GGDEF domain-containing protein [Lachnospiraceae bacterium]
MKKTIELMVFTEKIINDALRVALREQNATTALDLFLAHLGRESHSERIYIFEGKRGCAVKNTFEWCAEGITAEKDNLQDVPFEAVEWWYNAFQDGHCIVIKDVELIKEVKPLTYEYLKPQNIHSLIASPLILKDEIIGFYGVDNPPQEIMDHISDVAEIVGHFMVSLLERRRLMEKLEKLSFEDSLSGVKNRHALNHDIESEDVLTNVGIIYGDVLGLKKVNDTMGHQAGDELIVRASGCFKSVFRKTDIYRVGGDEFLVLCKGVEEEAFNSRVSELRRLFPERDVAISLGSLWRKEVTNIDALIAEADDLMYQEKRAYYAAKKKV